MTVAELITRLQALPQDSLCITGGHWDAPFRVERVHGVSAGTAYVDPTYAQSDVWSKENYGPKGTVPLPVVRIL